jgi:hypothetical protein
MKKTAFAILSVVMTGLVVGVAAAKSPALSENGRGKADVGTSIKGSGPVRGTPISGSFTAAFSADWGNASTRNGNRCARAGGEVTLSHAGDQLVLNSTGVACRASSDGHVAYSGSWTVFSGDGKYETQGAGKGKLTFTAVQANAMAIKLSGSFTMAERKGPY